MRWVANKFGHTYHDMLLSAHALYMGMRLGKVDMLDAINGDAWCNMYQERLWEQFATKYGKLMEKFDAVVCGYPPLFAWLYKDIDVPVIVNIPIRYEHGVDGNAERWQAWNEYLREGVDAGKIFLIANNLYDKVYAESFIGRPVRYIPVMAEYTGATYNPLFPHSIYYSIGDTKISGPLIIKKTDALPAGHSWQRVAEFRSVTWLPYNVSIMSTYEQYAAGIPMNFPTKRLAIEMHKQGHAYTQNSWAEQYSTESRSLVEPAAPHAHDPNNYKSDEALEYWLQYADAYNGRLDGITLFDSVEELNSLLMAPTHALNNQSTTIRGHHDETKAHSIREWAKLFDEVKRA